MKILSPLHRALVAAGVGTLLVASQVASAGPGAHGPNGEHLDAPAAAGAATGSRPRLEAHTESFELTATLNARELTIFIDRYATNDPVLKAAVEVESGGRKAAARFQADQGTYSVEDAPFLALLAAPGEHAMVFTVSAGDESDLLDGTLVTPADVATPTGGGRTLEIALAALAVAIGAVAWRWHRRRSGLRFAVAGGAR